MSDPRTLFRAMRAGNGSPTCGPEDLGVRLGIDVTLNADALVTPETGGMSVAPDDPMNLHRLHRPESLGGTGKKPVWQASEQALPDVLSYRPDPRRPDEHGFVEPFKPIDLPGFQSNLCDTQDLWSLAYV